MSSPQPCDFRSLAKILCRKAARGQPILIVLCGPSHSGKSVLAGQLCQHFQIVSSDEVRKRLTGSSAPCKREEKVWRAFDSLKCKALKQGQNLILDACHKPDGTRCKGRTPIIGRYAWCSICLWES